MNSPKKFSGSWNYPLEFAAALRRQAISAS